MRRTASLPFAPPLGVAALGWVGGGAEGKRTFSRPACGGCRAVKGLRRGRAFAPLSRRGDEARCAAGEWTGGDARCAGCGEGRPGCAGGVAWRTADSVATELLICVRRQTGWGVGVGAVAAGRSLGGACSTGGGRTGPRNHATRASSMLAYLAWAAPEKRLIESCAFLLVDYMSAALQVASHILTSCGIFPLCDLSRQHALLPPRGLLHRERGRR